MNTVIAIDIGASSGRLFNVTLTSKSISMDEMYRFENSGIEVGNRLYWDVLHIYHEILNGLQKCIQKDAKIEAVGIDTWGVDFGLLDRNGELLGNPYHYRDAQGNGMKEKANTLFGERTLFDRTGIQEIWFNTIFQLMGISERQCPSLQMAQTLLMIPDLLGYMLTGVVATEYTSASTTQLYQVKDRRWDREIIAKLGIRHDIFPKVLETGSMKGTIYPSLLKKADESPISLIATAQHDSASAAFAVPATSQDYLFINSGTWSILGIVIDHPICTEDVFSLGLSNEGAAFGRVKLVKTVMGMWLLQECRRCWMREGKETSYSYLDAEVQRVEPFRSLVDCDDTLFNAPEHMPSAIAQFCMRTGQPVPRTQGEFVRCIFESLAFMYKRAINAIETATKKSFPAVHLLGGASQNQNLCQYVADATAKAVISGPVEATALGNALVQMSALGFIPGDTAHGELVRGSFPVKTYRPIQPKQWCKKYEYFSRSISG